ncbi:hypothetical protein BDR26DRAFT_868744 [Obelidium mucronatum]|nr:hypothetical protein BDR26DRAFT_868744 [Obelidium mucronatum]
MLMAEGTTPFWIEYVGVMCVHLVGAVMNGFLIVLYLFGGKHMLADRIDKIVLALLVVCCLWSVITNIRLFVELSHPDLAYLGPVTGATSSLVITLLIGINALLALERYFISRGTEQHVSAKYHIASMSFSGTICLIVLGVFVTSPSAGGTWPDARPQYFIWLATVLTGFSVASVVIVYSYASTFFFLAAQLKQAMSTQRVDKWRTVMQRRLLVNSIIMSVSLLFFYSPQIACFIVFGAKILSPTSPEGLTLTAWAFLILALDVIASPALIMYFLNPIKRYRTGSSSDSDDELELDDDY